MSDTAASATAATAARPSAAAYWDRLAQDSRRWAQSATSAAARRRYLADAVEAESAAADIRAAIAAAPSAPDTDKDLDDFFASSPVAPAPYTGPVAVYVDELGEVVA